jgi:AGZA family xanthine/uracil permease-like MFS transporter
LRERNTTVKIEIIGGIVTFLTVAYIIPLNPIIIAPAPDITGHFLGGGTAPNFPAVAAATALLAGIMSIMMGAVANFPMVLAAGLGQNAFLAYTVVPVTTWGEALMLVVTEGVITLVMVLTRFRQAVFNAMPLWFKQAIGVGIGFFIALIGLVDAGFVRRGGGTIVTLGINGELVGWPVLVFVVGLALIVGLYLKKVPGAILIGIVGATLFAMIVEKVANVGSQFDATGKLVNPKGWGLNVPQWPDNWFDKPDLSTVGHLDINMFQHTGPILGIAFIFAFIMSDFFDTTGTVTAIGSEAGLLDEKGNPPKLTGILWVDSLAAALGGVFGTSSNTSYIESGAGVAQGARTGLSSVVAGGLFLLATFFAPLASVVPSEAAAAALVFVGCLMATQLGDIDWKNMAVAIPAFLTIALMPFTYSISVGIGAGVIAYAYTKLVTGKSRQVGAVMWIITLAFAAFFLLAQIEGWLSV